MALRDLVISPRRTIPARFLSARYSRSSGPGGQNVNKVASKVDLRLDLEGAREVLSETAAKKIRRVLENRLDGDGNLHVTSSEHRERSRNLEAALARMEALLRDALKPKKVRVKTRPSRAAKERRLEGKRRRSETKKNRRERFD